MIRPVVTLARPWLTLDLGRDMRALSWAINRPGFVSTRRIVWREVCNADLSKDFDVEAWFNRTLSARGDAESIGFLTSRNIGRYQLAEAQAEDVRALAVVTVGLSNAERVGQRRRSAGERVGTVNIAVHLDAGLSDTGLIEALSIVVQARTAAILDAGISIGPGRATGTGTDCAAIAAPAGQTAYAGLHTSIGEALGRAVYEAVRAGADDWQAEQAGL